MPLRMRHFAQLIALLAITLMPLCSLRAQEPGTTPLKNVVIEGYVLDRDREPVALAHVQVVGKTIGAVSSLKGFYQLSVPITEDSIAISFSAIGHRKVVKKFPSLKTNLKLNVELPVEAEELDVVTVTGSSSKRSSTLERMSPDAIKASVSAAGAIESIIGTQAGVSQSNELSSQYSVRGGNYDENLVYVNGIEIYRPLLVRSAEQEGLSFINPDLTSSVQFSAGGFTADYGDKTSSVLDIHYERPTKNTGGVSLSMLGSSAYFKSRHGQFTQATGVRYKRGLSMLNGKNNTIAEYDPHYFDAQTYLTYTISPELRIEALGNFSYTSYQFRPRIRESSFGTLDKQKKLWVYFNGMEKDLFVSFFGALSLNWNPSSRSRHHFSFAAFNSRELETYDISSGHRLDDDLEEGTPDGIAVLGLAQSHEHARNRLNSTVANALYRTSFFLSNEHRLEAGIDLKAERVYDYISEWEQRDSLGYSLPRDPVLLKVWRNLSSRLNMNSTRLSAYIQDRMKFETTAGRFFFTPGVRASWWSLNNEITVSPRVMAAFSPEKHESLIFRLSGGLYYQAPFYKELRLTEMDEEGNLSVRLNKQIKSQGAAMILLGGDYDFKLADSKFKFSVEAYYKYLFRINPYIRENLRLTYLGRNIGTGYIYGVDLKLFGEFVPGVDSWLTLSLSNSKQYLKGIGEMPLVNAPAYNASLFFQDYFPGLDRITLSLRAVISGGLPEVNPAKGFSKPAFKGSPYKRVDIGMQYILFKREDKIADRHNWLATFRQVSVGVEAFNLFDFSNINSYYWVSDAYNQQFAVPNYLTQRQWNIRLSVDF